MPANTLLWLIICIAICMITPVLPVAAYAAPAAGDHVVFDIARPADADALRSAGLLFLADLGDAVLVQGDERAADKLAASGLDFRPLLRVERDQRVLLLKARHPSDEAFYSKALVPLGRGRYLAVAGSDGAYGPGDPGFSRRVLEPMDFPKPAIPVKIGEPVEIIRNPYIEDLVAQTDPDSLYRTMAELSGETPAMIGGVPDTLLTRYSYSPEVDRAAEYLGERLEAYGLAVEFHEFAVSTHDLFSASFADSMRGWIAGGVGRVYYTRDGGATWTARHTGGTMTLWDACFVDTLRGWVVGNSGTVYRTTDGGLSWHLQDTPNTLALRAVCFTDSLAGFAAGYAGMMLETSDGGLSWESVASGTAQNLYDIYFLTADRGWASGRNGVLLYWDGASWSPQTSGVDVSLRAVHFADDSTGYAVGSGATVLRTTDGGATWLPIPVPDDVNPYFENVCFVDSAEGWSVGLGGTILHTEDAGATWERQISGTLFGLEWVRFVSPSEGWAGGYGGTILHTTDAGETWISQKRNLPSDSITLLRSVFGTLEGTTSEEEVIVCGHFDSVSEDPMNRAPGADDNATGTAGVVEAARVLSRHRFRKTIRFMCFSGEEIGLQGSGAYAPEARVRGDDIAGVVNLDMIGYVDEAPEDIDLIGNAASTWLVDFTAACAEAYVPGLPAKKIIDPTYLASDHASFWNSGYRALLAIEDADIAYPDYHSTADTLGNVTISLVENTTKLALATLAQAAVPDTTAPARGPEPVAGDRSNPGAAALVWPNPFRSTASVRFSQASGGHVDAAVYDVGGRLIRRLAGSHFSAGPHELLWDGTDERGRRVSAGIYLVRVDAGNRRFSSRVVLLR